MAEITRHIMIGDYWFELKLISKSVHAHSVMTDHKDLLNIRMDALNSDLKESVISHVEQHKEEKKL